MNQVPRNETLAEALYRDIDKDEYLNEIYCDLLYNYSLKLFNLDRMPREIPMRDALRFSAVKVYIYSYGRPRQAVGAGNSYTYEIAISGG